MENLPELSADPWQWPKLSPNQLRALSALGIAPTSPLFQYEAVLQCNAMRSSIEKGDGFSVLACVRICGSRGLMMPDWLVTAFNQRYDYVLNCRADSWDDPKAFGKPYRKGTHLAALRKARTLRFAVLNEVTKILYTEPATPIDVALFERVGKPLKIGKTLAEKYYYQARKLAGYAEGDRGNQYREKRKVRGITRKK